MKRQSKDRVGLSWRTELAAGIFAHQDQIDLVEVIADDWFDAPRTKVAALRTLAMQIPVQLHGTSAGLASSAPVKEKRLAKMARLVDRVQPESWSEHLAFVRAGGHEIGHLAAVPRTANTAADAAANIARARDIVGVTPMVENIATLIAPPASSCTEAAWLSSVVMAADAPLLLDLHNLFTNATNFGGNAASALETLRSLPLERVATVHIAGGRWLHADNGSDKRWLDDHLHPVPDAVFEMLEELAALAPQPLTVVLERDGAYPPMPDLLLELQLARAAMRRGRDRRSSAVPICGSVLGSSRGSSARLQALLAGIYVDDLLRKNFLSSPLEFAQSQNLTAPEAEALAAIDRTGLEMAARSFARKRQLREANRA
ncbi:MAG TPA: DUF692 family protein [Candidatus Sulfotelmatobacter sp.]|nr:DUF692 family protein [Candidatus Sulfotelmatobacter sp.]